jgi:predicted AlkP superfamily phosphohydrolase/phosphomutase
MKKLNTKVILVGLDGGSFELIVPLAEKGLLPTFKKMLDQGSWGVLNSTNPPTTPPAWSTTLTGVNPGRHGIFDFRYTYHATPSRPLITLKALKGLKIWQVIEKQKKNSGFLNVPILYPPEPLAGYMVSGMMTPSLESNFTYPPELKQKLLKNVPHYILDVDIPNYDVTFPEDITLFLEDVSRATQAEIDAFLYLYKNYPVDFHMVVLIAMDRIGHLLWKYLDSNSSFFSHPYSEVAKKGAMKAFKMLDQFLEELLHIQEKEEMNLIIMSDHGFGQTKAFFNVNRWLEEEGLLKLRFKKRLFKEAFSLAWHIGDSKFIKKTLPKKFQRLVRSKIRRSRSSFKSDLEDSIDWGKTKAFYASIPCHGIFIRTKGEGAVSSKEEYNKLRSFIKKELQAITINGEDLIDGIWDREELYQGPFVSYAPDIVFRASGYSVVPRPLLGQRKWLNSSLNEPNGFHRQQGIFIGYGERFKKQKRLKDISLLDIAPTVIDMLGLKVPPFMEGKIILG